MSWLDEVDGSRLPGQIAGGDAASFTDVAAAAMRSAWYANNTNARAVAIEEAYDKRSDEIFAATGRRIGNPMRMGSASDYEFGFEPEDQFAKVERELAELAKERPDLAHVIRADVSPIEDARARARSVETALADTQARYRGPWGTGTIAELAGGMVGALRDPANVATMFLGPTGTAGNGLKGLAWMALKQGAANAGVEVAFQPVVAGWRREAGLPYDASTFAMNVGSAFALGAGADLAVRGSVRAMQGVRGRVPVLDETGGIAGWETMDAALDRAARRSKDEVLRQAAAGDEAALRRLTKETPLADSPEMRALWEAYDDINATRAGGDGVDPAQSDWAELQAMRAAIDPEEPPPAPVRPPSVYVYKIGDVTTRDLDEAIAGMRGEQRIAAIEVPHDRVGELGADGLSVPDDLAERPTFIDPVLVRLRRRLVDGDITDLEAAAAVRDMPWLLAGVETETAFLRQTRSIARLSDAAFDMVMDDVVEPEWAALVADLVPDAGRHADIIGALADLSPATPAEARRAIGVLAAERSGGDLLAAGGIDDVTGAEGVRQIEALQRLIGDDGEVARQPPQVRSREAVAAAADDRIEAQSEGALPAMVAEPPATATVVAHPDHPELSLPLTVDGVVAFWRLGMPHRGDKGSFWTSSRAQVEAYAQRAPGLEIVRLDLAPADLSAARPLGAVRNGRVHPDETLFSIDYETSRGDARVEGVVPLSQAEREAARLDAAALRTARDPLAGQSVDATGLPQAARSPPASVARQMAQTNMATARSMTGGARRLITAMRRGGIDAVEEMMVEMGPAAVRDAAARLAGDMTRQFAELGSRQQAAVLGARALLAVADELDGLRGGGAGEMRALAAALERKALAGEVGETGLGREATDFERVVTAMETRGIGAVEDVLDSLGPAGRRELAERIVPHRIDGWDDMTGRAQAELIGRAVIGARMAMSEGARDGVAGRALRDAPDAALQRGLDEVDALERMAELIKECKL